MTFLPSRISRGQEGQILLVVILTMIVALTVGLSIAARIVTELRISKQNEESQRAFQAAEAGIQQTLSEKRDFNVGLDNNAKFSTEFISESREAIVMNNGLAVDQASGGDVWLSDYSQEANELFRNPMGVTPENPTGSALDLEILWGSAEQDQCSPGSGENTAPAIEVTILTGPLDNPKILKNVYEAPGCSRIPGATAGRLTTNNDNKATAQGPTFHYTAELEFTPQLRNVLIMKVIPIYNSTIVGLRSGSGLFPPQGAVVTSTGTSGDTVRKVTYYQSYPQIPVELFPYSLMSQ